MFRRKNVDQDSGFTATLRLPKYIPKDNLLGKVVFDYDLERVGQIIDWTYTPEGIISLVVSRKKNPEEGDRVFIPFKYIERVGRFILLSEPMDSLLPKNASMGKEDREEKEELGKTLKEKETRDKGKEKRELKGFDELEKEVLSNLIKPPEAP